MKRILIIAGEASSDMHAANLVRSILELYGSDVEFAGLGGDNLIDTGKFVPEYHNRDFAVFGFCELAGHVGKLLKAQRHFREMASMGAYDLAVLMDYSGFNIPLASHLTRRRIPVIYYISPQVWVWRSYRVYKLAKYCREILTVFPFERDFYKKYGVDVKYMGNPILDQVDLYRKDLDPARLEKEFKQGEKRIIAVLPGSRLGEIKYIMPVMVETCRILSRRYNGKLRFVIPVASTLKIGDIRKYTDGNPVDFEFVKDRTYDVYTVADYAIAASGTSTVECALFNVPMTIVYRVSTLSAFMFRNLVRYKKPIGMVNLLYGDVICNEFFQEKADPELIASDVEKNLFDEDLYLSVREKLKRVHDVLYTGQSPSVNAAREVLRYL
ncbi:MAG: lipid-A-disaccharide synthase [Oligoflexia bacterium]|nr:lipid-A-disaccharide synthase [Oligoflexia bacterium]